MTVRSGECERVVEIPVASIVPSPWQRRRRFDEQKLQELSESIRINGLQQPIKVRHPDGSTNGTYELVFGERRLRAHKLIDRETIKAFVTDISAEEARTLVLVENLHREDLAPTEEAANLMDLLEAFEGNKQAVVDKIGKSMTYLTDRLLVLDQPEEIQAMLDEKKINLAQLKVISELADPKAMINAANIAAKLNLTANELRGRLQRQLGSKKTRNTTSTAEGNVKFQQVSTSLVNLYDLLENFDYAMLGDEKKKETMLKQIGILEKSLARAKEQLGASDISKE